jgi:hypothetical protein
MTSTTTSYGDKQMSETNFQNTSGFTRQPVIDANILNLRLNTQPILERIQTYLRQIQIEYVTTKEGEITE